MDHDDLHGGTHPRVLPDDLDAHVRGSYHHIDTVSCRYYKPDVMDDTHWTTEHYPADITNDPNKDVPPEHRSDVSDVGFWWGMEV